MNVRKSIFAATAASISVLLSGAITIPAHAQDPGAPAAPGARAGRQQRQARRQPPLLRALAALDLPADTRTKVDALVSKYQTDMAALAPEDRRSKGRQMNQTLQKDVDAILTPAQQVKLRQEMFKAGGGPLGPIVRGLDLTTEQQTKAAPILDAANEQLATIEADENLKGREKREKIRPVIENAAAKMKPLLTEAQRTKLDEAVANLAKRGAGRRAAPGATDTNAGNAAGGGGANL